MIKFARMTHRSLHATYFVCVCLILQAHSWARQPVPEFHIYEASGVGHFAVDGQTRDVARPGVFCQPLRILPGQRRTPTHRERRQREAKTQRRVSIKKCHQILSYHCINELIFFVCFNSSGGICHFDPPTNKLCKL